jgi:hypothetical protein
MVKDASVGSRHTERDHPSTKEAGLSGNQVLRIGAGVGIVIGAFLPWVQVLGIGVAGTNGDGQITLVLGLVVIVLSLLVKRWAAIAVAILGALCAIIAFADMTNAAASGIYLTLAGGLVAAAAGIVAARSRAVPVETTDA